MIRDLEDKKVQTLVERSTRALTTIAPRLPTFDHVNELMEELEPAQERGYLLPDEDEKVRTMFASFLTTRAALMSILDDLRPYALEEMKGKLDRRPEVFVVAFCAACLLVRAGRFVVDNFRKKKLIWRKLDEAEPRFGIPPKQFTKIYRSLGSPRNIVTFLGGVSHYQANREELHTAVERNPAIAPVLEILKREAPYLESSKRYYARHGLKYRWHSFLRRHHSGFKKFTFGLFKLSGSLIAELRNHWKRKRVTPGVQRKISKLLTPGDVIITRHDDATSNLFLPGFWPHGALYIGTHEQRQRLDGEAQEIDLAKCPDPNCVLEARKDGVLFRQLDDTLAVDACVVIRPKLSPEEVRRSIARAMTHEGKGYDFEFDFRRSTTLVCTEVIYRAYHGIGGLHFELKTRAGRYCLSAEDLLDEAVEGSSFEVVCIYGVDGNRFAEGDRARELLIQSYRDDATKSE